MGFIQQPEEFSERCGLQRPAAAKPQLPSPQQEQSKGYRLTEHVKKYYETARL